MSLPPFLSGEFPSAGMSYQRMTASQLSGTPCSRLNRNIRSRVTVIGEKCDLGASLLMRGAAAGAAGDDRLAQHHQRSVRQARDDIVAGGEAARVGERRAGRGNEWGERRAGDGRDGR